MKLKLFTISVMCGFFLADCENELSKGKRFESTIRRRVDSCARLNGLEAGTDLINDTSICINLHMSPARYRHFRRRAVLIDRLIFDLGTALRDVKWLKVRNWRFGFMGEALTDSVTYNEERLFRVRFWDRNDKFHFLLMSEMIKLSDKKYEELSDIGRYFAKVSDDSEIKKAFDPDFAFFLEHYIDELYGEYPGTNNRLIMEYFYTYAHDPSFATTLRPEDLVIYLRFGDSVRYENMFPKELKEIKTISEGVLGSK